MPVPTASQFYEASSLDRVKFSLPAAKFGPDAYFWITELPPREVDDYQQSLWRTRRGNVEMAADDATARLCILAIRDDDGNRIFDDSEVVKLSTRCGSRILKEIAEVAMRISGITKGEIEELVETKKSPTAAAD